MTLNLLSKSTSIRSIAFYFLMTYSLIHPIVLNASPQAQLNVSRTSGPAPLAVYFDATGTTDTDNSISSFRQLGYSFCFGDNTNENWSLNGLSKNYENGGPLASHVFTQPGVYEVSLRVTNSTGQYSDTSVTITVLDANTVFDNTNTVVISTGNDFSGAPINAQQIANITSWPNWEHNTRYLLKEGDDFSSLGNIWITDISNFHLGSFGNSTKPIVSSIYISMDEDNAATPPQNGVIQGLAAHSISQRLMFTNLLIYQNDVIGDGSSITFGAANTWYAINQRGNSQPEDWKQSGPIFIVENHVNMQGDPTGPLNAIAGLGQHIAVLGNRSELAKEHTLRIFGTYKAVIGHNILTGPATDETRHDFKLMSNGINDWPSDHSIFEPGTTTEVLPNTQYVRIHNNTFGRPDAPHSWHLQVAPQDDGRSGTIEGLRDIIIENNTFIDGTIDDGVERGIHTLGHNIIERNNNFPTVWTTPIRYESYPSTYTTYSSLYTSFWHGPYYLDDVTPVTNSSICSTALNLNQPDNRDSIKVFPIPVKSGYLNLELPYKPQKGSLKIVNLMGKTIYSETIHDKTALINLNSYQKSLYILIIETQNETFTKRILLTD
ncbi:PKD domain-containing protein [Seonamhaeicola marinus]|uniref:T9SS type A sorting domain-containing protein n=1 Tax=Seonamhaeicola marinus TaxID=1912246 RepID=A0A5D0I515_9FLAO|nr:PKD domain-containing protein [Seonamhaeicola marinus]TYA78468.1 T9SS type A sorting domain-containing protein [Seonamhaeicola marinus]